LEKEIAEIYQRNPSFFNSSYRVQTQQEFVKSQTEPFKNDARLLAFIRYNPKVYLQSIRCPIFIAYAKNDNLINYLNGIVKVAHKLIYRNLCKAGELTLDS